MKTSIKKTLLSILLAIIALGLVIGLSLIEIGKFSLAYYLAMFVLGCEIGDNAGKRTEKIFEKIESRKEAKKEEMLREELYSLNPGDRLFLLGFDKVYEYLIVKKSFGPHPTFAIQPVGDTFSGVWDFEVHNYKTTFFPSREEAEAALVKRETPPAIPKKEYHCKNCKESFTYANFKNPPNHCTFCGGELAETTEVGMILSELFYSVEHEAPDEIKLAFGKDGKAKILNEDYVIYCADEETFEKVKEAVEKQIPKGLKLRSDGNFYGCCNCGNLISSGANYCGLCGQATTGERGDTE